MSRAEGVRPLSPAEEGRQVSAAGEVRSLSPVEGRARVSPIESVRAYLSERYRARLFVPLAALIVAIGSIAAASVPPIAAAATSMAVAWLLVLSFRVLDDLADRGADAVTHPERVMVRTVSTTPFIALGAAAWLGATLAAAMLDDVLPRLAASAAIALFLAAWYAVRSGIRVPPLLNAHLVLAKYPAIAFVAAPVPLTAALGQRGTLLPLAALYLGLCIYEAIDDPAVRRSPATKPVMIAELALLALIPILILVSDRGAP